MATQQYPKANHIFPHKSTSADTMALTPVTSLRFLSLSPYPYDSPEGVNRVPKA